MTCILVLDALSGARIYYMSTKYIDQLSSKPNGSTYCYCRYDHTFRRAKTTEPNDCDWEYWLALFSVIQVCVNHKV